MSGYSEIAAKFALELYSIYKRTCFCFFFFCSTRGVLEIDLTRFNLFNHLMHDGWPSYCSQTSSWRRKLSHLIAALCAVSFVSLIENRNNRTFSWTKVRIWKHLHKRQSSWITAASFRLKRLENEMQMTKKRYICIYIYQFYLCQYMQVKGK